MTTINPDSGNVPRMPSLIDLHDDLNNVASAMELVWMAVGQTDPAEREALRYGVGTAQTQLNAAISKLAQIRGSK